MRRFIHNVIVHPLLVLWPRFGEWLHDRTVPGNFTSITQDDQ